MEDHPEVEPKVDLHTKGRCFIIEYSFIKMNFQIIVMYEITLFEIESFFDGFYFYYNC